MIRARKVDLGGHGTLVERLAKRTCRPYRTKPKQTRFSRIDPVLPVERLRNITLHKLVHSKHQRKCKYCMFLHLKEKAAGEETSNRQIGRPRKECNLCHVSLCTDCFEPYHTL